MREHVAQACRALGERPALGRPVEGLELPGDVSSERLKSLQKRLEKAVQQEDFELAANLRDEIRQIAPRSSTPAAP